MNEALLKDSEQTYPTRRRFIKSILAGSFLTGATGALFFARPWKHIVIHHSAGDSGDVAFLKRVHRQRQKNDPVDSMAYHFAVGNGRGMPMGHVAWDLRWNWKLWGTHVSARNTAANLFGIGICLVGNFENYPVPDAQYLSLCKLCKTLMNRHQISLADVMLHRTIDGERTRCPGRHFPADRFYGDIAALSVLSDRVKPAV